MSLDELVVPLGGSRCSRGLKVVSCSPHAAMLQSPGSGLVPTRTCTLRHLPVLRQTVACNVTRRARIWDNLDTDVENLNASPHDDDFTSQRRSTTRSASMHEPEQKQGSVLGDGQRDMDAWAAAQQRMAATGAAAARAGWSRDPDLNSMGPDTAGPDNAATADTAPSRSRRRAAGTSPPPAAGTAPESNQGSNAQDESGWGEHYITGDWGDSSWEGNGWGRDAGQASAWGSYDADKTAFERPDTPPAWGSQTQESDDAASQDAYAPHAHESRARGSHGGPTEPGVGPNGPGFSASPGGDDDGGFGPEEPAGFSGRWATSSGSSYENNGEQYGSGVGEEGGRWRQQSRSRGRPWDFFASGSRRRRGRSEGEGAGGAPEGTDPGTYGSSNPSDITLLSRSEMVRGWGSR